MFSLVVLFLVLFSNTNGVWEAGNSGPIRADMKFYVKNTTCNDALTKCQACKSESEDGVYLDTFEYTEGPAKFQFSGEVGTSDWSESIVQEDPREPFRFCTQSENTHCLHGKIVTDKFSLCMDNMFSGVPSTCTKPIAVISTISQSGDNKPAGDQTLYCAI